MVWMTDTFQTNALQEAYMQLSCEHPRPCNVASVHTSSLSIAIQWCSCSYAPCPRDKRPWRSQCVQETEQSLPEQSFLKAFSLSLPPFPRFFVSMRWSILFFSFKKMFKTIKTHQRWCVYMCTWMWMPERSPSVLFLGSHPSFLLLLFFFFRDPDSDWVLRSVNISCCSGSPRDLPVFTSPVLGFQVNFTKPSSYPGAGDQI